MLHTYLNNNQNMAYPFFGDTALPFPMSCITGLGLCLVQEEGQQDTNSFFASDVVITQNAVWISICRRTGDATGVIGLMYANTDGYYTYIPSWVLDAVYEDESMLPKELRYVYAAWQEDFDPSVVAILTSDMQVFYSYVKYGSGITAERRKGCGYMILGTIPPDAVGIYRGEFYIDPSCITYMPPEVYSIHTSIEADYTSKPAGQLITIEPAGLLSCNLTGGTVTTITFVNTDPENLGYIVLQEDSRQHVTTINGGTIAGSYTKPYPALRITTDIDGVAFRVIDRSDINTLTIEVNGNHEFPNCYAGDDDAGT